MLASVEETLRTSWNLVGEFYLDGFVATMAVAAVAPVLGTLLVARRMPFLAIAVPQLSACGVAAVWFAFPLLFTVETDADGGLEIPPHSAEFAGSATVLILGLAVLSWLGRRHRGTGVHAAAMYLLALAATQLFYVESQYEEFAEHTRHHGQILTVMTEGRDLVLITCAVVGGLALWLSRRSWLAAFDPDLARLRGVSPGWSLFIVFALISAHSALCVPVVGPEAVLAFLLIPPIVLKGAVPSLRSYAPFASLAGVSGAACSFVFAVQQDWPLGPTVLVATFVASCAVAVPLRLVSPILHR